MIHYRNRPMPKANSRPLRLYEPPKFIDYGSCQTRHLPSIPQNDHQILPKSPLLEKLERYIHIIWNEGRPTDHYTSQMKFRGTE